MCDDDYGLSRAVPEVEEDLVYLLLGHGVEVAGGFIGQKHRRPVDDGAGDRDSLLLAAGEFRRLVAGARGQSHALQQSRGFLFRLLHLPAGDKRRYHDVLECGELRQQVVGLEHEAYAPAAEGRESVAPEPERILPVYGQCA